jgi:5-formyltetrahydrofolate cyclo-ligase
VTFVLADQVFEKLKELEQFKRAKNISIYISMPTCEIVTTKIIHFLLNTGTNTNKYTVLLYFMQIAR